MYDLMVIESPKKKHLHIKNILLLLLCILIITWFCAILVHIYKFYHRKTETSAHNIDETSFSRSDTKHKTYYINSIIKQDYLQKKSEYIEKKYNTPLSDEQYNNLLNIYKESDEKVVYLTFDDGPSPNITPLILDLLKQENIQATFFLLGSNVERYPELVQREFQEGHFLANHGYSHKYAEIYKNNDTILNDYLQCEQAIRKALHNDNFVTKVYRFPGGSTGGKYHNIKTAGKEVLKENHIAYLDWNALTRDAEGTPTRESIMEDLKETVGEKNTVVLLMHDSSSKILTYDTLPEVIAFFRDNGYTFKTLYDVI